MRPFSSRLPGLDGPNRLARARERLGVRGVSVIDLTESNPTRVGFRYPARLLDSLASPRSLSYRPDPRGMACAREAVAAYLGRHQLDVAVDRIVLTTSTSDAYSIVFKLLCDPGHEVAVPHPSYPLLDHLTRLEAVTSVPYALEFHGRWQVDHSGLRRQLTSRTRAVLIVNPNNPTGSFVRRDDLDTIVGLCRERGMALVVDEVFGFYPMTDTARGVSVLDQPTDVLTFVFGGLSKAVGLPQLKLGWIILAGPDTLVDRSLDRLDLICDTYLSVATPVQVAADQLLREGATVTVQIAGRIRENYAALQQLVAAHPAVGLLPVEGGWYAVVQVPATRSEEALVLELLEHEHVFVHPGYFFDFPREAFLVMSLLPEPAVFEEAARRVLAYAAGTGH